LHRTFEILPAIVQTAREESDVIYFRDRLVRVGSLISPFFFVAIVSPTHYLKTNKTLNKKKILLFKMDALSKWIQTPEADKIAETGRKKA